MNPFIGFSEDLYGNNWFVLSTLDTKVGSGAICGILKNVPELSFEAKWIDGPQKVFTDLVDKFLTGSRGSVGAQVASALGTNFNRQISGNFTKKMIDNQQFQEDGFTLEFDCYRHPEKLFFPECYPSSQKDVVKYLSRLGTVDSNDQYADMFIENIESAVTAAGNVLLIGGQAVDTLKQGFTDAWNKDTFAEGVNTALDTVAKTGDLLTSRKYSDKQRLEIGANLFNEPLHRLDILRGGVLDTFLVVGIESWSYQLDKESLGEKMTVEIKVVLDQRITADRLRLYDQKK